MGAPIQTNLDNLDSFRARKIIDLDAKCCSDIEKGIVSQVTGHTYRFNKDEDQGNFTQKFLDIVNGTAPATIYWKTEDAGILPHTQEQFKAVFKELGDAKEYLISRYWELKNTLQTATDFKGVMGVTW